MNISGCIIIENKNHIYMSQNNQISGIYVIVDPEHTLGRDIIYVVKQVLDAGANIIQLRDKISTCEEISRSAHEIQKIIDKKIGEEIYDDHVPLWEHAQIPTIDIIDFKYPNLFYNHWHTQQDTPENCSPKSLEQVGTLLVNYIYAEKHK